MSETGTTRSLVFERQMKHPPEKVWRALTQSHLIAEWLMENDFVPKVGHRFTFRATPLPGWSGIANCEVLAVDPPHLLSYRWGDGTESASGLVTVVTWTLMPRDGGTLVRMEQSGFRTPDELAFKRMGKGWPRVLERLENVAGRVDLDA
jgi:uncharacterized protein YndB with AHSA1/START domain